MGQHWQSIYDIPPSREFPLQAGGTLSEDIGFRCYSVAVDNPTQQWIHIKNTLKFIPPGASNWVVNVPSVETAEAEWGAPPNVAQGPLIPNATAVLTYFSYVLPPGGSTNAVSLASGVFPQPVEYQAAAQYDGDVLFFGPSPYYDPRHPLHAGGAKGTGLADDYSAIQDCLTLATNLGGGWVRLRGTPGTIYGVSAGLQYGSGVAFTMDPGVTLKYIGAAPAAGNTFELLDTPFLPSIDRLVFKGTLDCNNVPGVYGIHMHSLQHSRLKAFVKNVAGLDAAGNPLPAVLIAADVAAAGPAPLFQAVAVSDFDIWVEGAPIGVQYRGIAGRAPATLNRWGHIYLGGITKVGLDLIETCDSNSFERVDVIFAANGAKGILLNDLLPAATDHDVKGLKFGQITFTGTGGATGCKGIVLNWTSAVDLGDLFYDASAFAGGGQLIQDVAGHGYRFMDGGQLPPVLVHKDIQLIQLGQSTIADSVQSFINQAAIAPDPSMGALVLVDYNQATAINAPVVPGAPALGGMPYTNQGRRITFRFRHDNTANVYALAFNAIYKRAGGAFPNTNAANALDTLTFEEDDTTGFWNEVARAINLS